MCYFSSCEREISISLIFKLCARHSKTQKKTPSLLKETDGAMFLWCLLKDKELTSLIPRKKKPMDNVVKQQ